MDSTAKWLLKTAQEEVQKAMAELPADLANRARQVTVVFEPVPAQALLDEGWDADLLGMFSGSPIDESTEAQASFPPQIHLFYENLWDFADGIEEAYREEVQITYIHELGHYLGLDEDELDDRGLL